MAAAPVVRADDLSSISLPVTVLGVALNVPLVAHLDVQTSSGGLDVALSASADLGDLQAHALEIAQKLDLPTDNCDRDGINPVVNGIDAAAITPGPGGSAVITLKGRVTLWVCQKVLGQKLKTKVPDKEIGVTVSGALILSADGGTAPKIALAGRPDINADDGAVNAVLDLFKDKVTESLSRTITSGLDVGPATASITDLLGKDVHFDAASFGDSGGHLTFSAAGRATLTPDQLAALLAEGK